LVSDPTLEDFMRSIVRILGTVTMLVVPAFLGGAAIAQNSGTPAVPGPGCHFGEVIDGSTADDARTKIVASGFTDVHDLKKSCDNFWHGKASFAGRVVNVVLSPSGKVMLESD
jgi:hypothetical protein